MEVSKLLYVRMFHPDGLGHIEKRHELRYEVLGLPKGDLDEETRKAPSITSPDVSAPFSIPSGLNRMSI